MFKKSLYIETNIWRKKNCLWYRP